MVGKRSWFEVFGFLPWSGFDIIYKAAYIRAHIVDSGNSFRRTPLYDNLDQSEKAQVSYLMGMALAQLFARKFLRVGWLVHLSTLDVPILAASRRPDLVGRDSANNWIVVEAKGRSGGFSGEDMRQARQQLASLIVVNGTSPVLKVAFQAYYRTVGLSVKWEDPDDEQEEVVDIRVTDNDFFERYYRSIFHLFSERRAESESQRRNGREFRILRLNEAGMTIGIDAEILGLLEGSRFEEIPRRLAHYEDIDEDNLSLGLDGVFIELDSRWPNP